MPVIRRNAFPKEGCWICRKSTLAQLKIDNTAHKSNKTPRTNTWLLVTTGGEIGLSKGDDIVLSTLNEIGEGKITNY